MLTPVTRPRGVFIGRNFMTPTVLAYYRLRHGYAELSEGTGFSSAHLYGVTIRDSSGRHLDPDPSTCFEKKQEALDLISSLSKE